MWSQNRDQDLVPDYGSIFWTFYRDNFNVVSEQGPKVGLQLWVHILDLLTHGPSISPHFGPYIGPQFGPYAQNHIGTMVLFYIMQNMAILRSLKGTMIWTLNPGSCMWSQNMTQNLDYGSIFWTFYRDHFNVVPKYVHILVHTYDHNLVPMHRSRFCSLYIGPHFGPS